MKISSHFRKVSYQFEWPRAKSVGAFALGVVMILLTAPSSAQPLPPDVLKDVRADWVKVSAQVTQLRSTKPEKAVVLCQEFIQQHPNMDASTGIDVYARLGSLQTQQFEDPVAALETYTTAIELYGQDVGAHVLARGQAQQLMKLKRYPEAQVVLLKYWPSLIKTPQNEFSHACRLLFDALNQQGQRNLAQKMLEAAMRCNPRLLHDSGTSQNDWIWDEIIGYYLTQNEADQALSWAKLYFVLCAYSDDAMARAGRDLAMVWALTAPGTNEFFLLALDDATKPNPLTSIPLPPIDAPQGLPFDCPSFEQLWEKSGPVERVSLLLWSGRPEDRSRAIVEGMRVSGNKNSPEAGVQQVCRVLKAADLRLVSAEEYLRYIKTGQGNNPVSTLLAVGAGTVATPVGTGTQFTNMTPQKGD